jgi:hypothetical protein
MKYFLILIILGLCGGGYYEYTQLQTKISTDEQEIHALGTKVDASQLDNKTLTDDNVKLAASVKSDEDKITDLNKQLSDAKKTIAAIPPPAPVAPPPGGVPSTPSKPTNNLGTITTSDGKTYQNCQLLKVDPDGIVVNDADGITKIVYEKLPADLEKRFGYDPLKPGNLTDDQVQALEKQRAAQAGN